jgi:hypothetical protein
MFLAGDVSAENARADGTPAAAARFAMQRNQDIRMQAPPSKASQLRRNAYYCRMLATPQAPPTVPDDHAARLAGARRNRGLAERRSGRTVQHHAKERNGMAHSATRNATRRKPDLIAAIADTVANHPRLSAAVAFQMGVLLGQVINNRAATMRALKRGAGAAPAAIASALPRLGLFETGATASPHRTARKASRTGRKRRKT